MREKCGVSPCRDLSRETVPVRVLHEDLPALRLTGCAQARITRAMTTMLRNPAATICGIIISS